MLHCSITHRGVPLGSVAIGTATGIVTAEFLPLPAFDSWRPLARDVGDALRAAGFFGRDASPGSTAMPAGSRSRTLDAGVSWGRELELRDADGQLVPTSFIEIASVPEETPPLDVAWIGFQGSTASIPAAVLRSPIPAEEAG